MKITEISVLFNWMINFLNDRDLATISIVNRAWQRHVIDQSNVLWKTKILDLVPGVKLGGGLCYFLLSAQKKFMDKKQREGCELGIIHSPLACHSDYKLLYRLVYQSVIGKSFYRDYFGSDITQIPPVPESLLSRADYLLYRPDFLPVQVEPPWELDNEGVLVEGRSKEPTIISVPVTLKNIDTLAKKHLKRGFSVGLSEDSWKEALIQHGDKRFPASWVGQRKISEEVDTFFTIHQILLNQKGLSVVSLIDRVFFNIFGFIRSGKPQERDKIIRTSTVTTDSGIPPQSWPTSICWRFEKGIHSLQIVNDEEIEDDIDSMIGIGISVIPMLAN